MVAVICSIILHLLVPPGDVVQGKARRMKKGGVLNASLSSKAAGDGDGRTREGNVMLSITWAGSFKDTEFL